MSGTTLVDMSRAEARRNAPSTLELPLDCPRTSPIERAFGDGHDKCTQLQTQALLYFAPRYRTAPARKRTMVAQPVPCV
jgi:hypothetical protein